MVNKNAQFMNAWSRTEDMGLDWFFVTCVDVVGTFKCLLVIVDSLHTVFWLVECFRSSRTNPNLV